MRKDFGMGAGHEGGPSCHTVESQHKPKPCGVKRGLRDPGSFMRAKI